MTQALLIALLLLPAAAEAEGEGLYRRGVDQLASGQVETAVDSFREVIEQYPDDASAPGALLKWAEAEVERGDPERALELYAELQQRYPQHRLARTASDRAVILAAREQRDDVEAAYRAILESYVEHEFATSAGKIQALIATNPDHAVVPEAQCWLGRMYHVASDPTSSRAHYQAAFAASAPASPPCAVRAHQDLARMALDDKNFADADEHYQALAALGDEEATAAGELSRELRTARTKDGVWQAIQFLAALALLGLFWGYPWRHVHMRNVGAGLAGGGVMLVATFIIGIFCCPETRAMLIPLAVGLSSLALIHGIRRGLPASERHQRIYPIALVWLVLTVAIGTLYTFNRL
jgi:TolA-binding protein